MDRLYERTIKNHINKYHQMVFLAGPRQVGKTTIAKQLLTKFDGIYVNWDILKDREIILRGPQQVMNLHKPKSIGTKKNSNNHR